MPTILSPAEALGLSGAVLDSRVRNAGGHIADSTYARIAKQLRADAFANEIVYERDGVREAVRLMLRPLLAQREQLTYVHQVCLRLTEALKRLPSLYLQEPGVRDLVTIGTDEESWLRETWTPEHARRNPVYGRLDAVCDFTTARWQDTLKFMEPNLSGVGGIQYAPIVEQLIMRDVVPSLLAHDPELSIELPLDQRDLFVQLLIDHARALRREACQLCFVEPKYEHDGPNEQAQLRQYLADRHGLTITHADPRELIVKNGEVFHGDVRVDVAYRDYEIRDLIALEKECGRPLEAMRLLFRENRIVSSLTGDFDHKSGFELLTDPRFAEKLFSPEDIEIFHRHVLWTRLVSDRRTSLPNHAPGELLDYIRKHQEELVLKPNRGYGGTDVAVGVTLSARNWERLVDDAVASASDPNRSWVVQTATQLPVAEFPLVGEDGRVFSEPFYAVMGFAATGNGLAALCRVSQKQVVNVAQHGGIAGLLLGEPPKDLRIPKRPVEPQQGILAAFRRHVTELLHLDQTIALLEWDEETKLPVAGRSQRGEQTATLEGMRHNLLMSDQLGDLIEEVTHQTTGDADLSRELHLLRRERRRALAVPDDLVRKLANAKSQTLAAWEVARKENDFDTFAAPFSTLLSLVKERAMCLSIDLEPYDALLDEHEPGMTRSRLDPLFDEMRGRLVPIAQAASHAPRDPVDFLAAQTFLAEGQWELSRRVLRAIGFDFARGRLDASTHPFTMTIGGDDVRVTSRVKEHDPWSNLLSTLHEAGHGLYDQGFLPRDRGTLLADGASAAMHEGQARLWENHIGRSKAFMSFLIPHLHELFPGQLDGIVSEQLWQSINRVRLGANRVGADEMTYHLHIMLRYRLEIALLSDTLVIDDLPGAWNDLSEELLGIRPASDREGVLQDVHWAVGMFGYFPTYTIGSLYAAQLIESYRLGADLDSEIRAGQFGPLRQWLQKNIYEVGQRCSAEEIISRVTGRGLDISPFFDRQPGK